MCSGSSSSTVIEAPHPFLYREIVERALHEDLNHGDITTLCTIAPGQRSDAVIVAKESCVVAGVFVAMEAFRLIDADVRFSSVAEEGSRIDSGDSLLEVHGYSSALLAAERVALNFLQRLCGTATMSSRFVEAVNGTGVRVVDTRKTTPGFRLLEKYAVRVGGCLNHRFDLSDGILIKDNHIAACGSVGAAVRRALENAPHTLRVEVEVTSLEQLREAVEAGADVLLLDNMNISELTEAVEYARSLKPGLILEASGGVTLENVRKIAETGVDVISSGVLTHSAPAVDLSMRIV